MKKEMKNELYDYRLMHMLNMLLPFKSRDATASHSTKTLTKEKVGDCLWPMHKGSRKRQDFWLKSVI